MFLGRKRHGICNPVLINSEISNKAIEFMALRTDMNGMIAENELCRFMGVKPPYKETDFKAISEKMRELKRDQNNPPAS
jgi:hypothetical protein